MAEDSHRAHSAPPQGGHFEGQIIQGQARAHLGDNINYHTSYQRTESSLLGGLFDRRKKNAELLDAASHGYIHRLQAQLRAGADIDHTNKNKATALHHAAYGGYRDCVQTLLEAGSKVNVLDSWSRTPLGVAVQHNKIDAALCLISAQGVDLKLSISTGAITTTITAEGAMKWKDQLSAMLQNYQRRLNGADFMCTPISLAIMKGHLDMVKSIVNHKQDLGMDLMCGENVFWSAATLTIIHGHAATLRWLLSEQLIKADGSDHEGDYLMTAASTGNFECAQILLEHGAAWNTAETVEDQDLLLEALNRATAQGRQDMMQQLIMSGANVNGKPIARGPLFWRTSVPRGYHPAPIHLAAGLDQADAATLLINHGCDVDIRDNRGWTALMEAAIQGNVSVAEVLLRAGANAQLKEKQGRTAWYFATDEDIARKAPENNAGRARIARLLRNGS